MPAHEELYAQAQGSWPDVHVPEDVFRSYVAARAGTAPVSVEAASGLYVACACARGDPRALKAFEEHFVPDLERALRRMRLPRDQMEDVLQALRAQLLVGEAGADPRISEYSGQGDLRSWLRVSVVRSALKLLRRTNARSFEDVDAALEARSLDDDPELSFMKGLYRDAFRGAFRAAFEELEPREKNLLRQHFVDELTVDDLGRLYGVHRATAARWLQKAREALLGGTRKEFTKRAGITPRECESVLRLVRSRFDVTLRRLLA